MFTDYVLNGQSYGEIGEQMAGCHFDPGLRRPYYDRDGKKYVTVNTGRKTWDEKLQQAVPVYQKRLITDMMHAGVSTPVMNATTLRKDEWIMLDQAVIKAARGRLRAWADLAAYNTYKIDGMSKMLLEYETMSDPGSAVVDMDGMAAGPADTPLFQLQSLPLPITHSDFWYSSRRLAASRNTGMGLDTLMAEAAGRRVAEMVEKTLIGVETGITYGATPSGGQASTVRGYTNTPQRATKTDMTAPDGTNGSTVLGDWLDLRDELYQNNFWGPYMAYTSTDYDQYLDNLFSTSEPSAGSLRSRLLQIDDIVDIKRLDYLTDTFTVILVQMTSDVARAVIGMDFTTMQWESMGGMRTNFKVMAIMSPQLRADYNGNSGIAHGTTS